MTPERKREIAVLAASYSLTPDSMRPVIEELLDEIDALTVAAAVAYERGVHAQSEWFRNQVQGEWDETVADQYTPRPAAGRIFLTLPRPDGTLVTYDYNDGKLVPDTDRTQGEGGVGE